MRGLLGSRTLVMLVVTLAALTLAGQVSAKAANAVPAVPSPIYSLELFEGGEPIVDPIGFSGTVEAVATVKHAQNVKQVEFRWFACEDLVYSSTVPLVGGVAEDVQDVFFLPECTEFDAFPWVVEADFGNGHAVQKELIYSFFVLPESPIGPIAMALSSIGSLGAYLYIRSRRALPFSTGSP